MDPRLLEYYNRELQFMREMGAEFARAYPKVAARLSLEGLECADPYVERLLEGFAFLAARVQLKLDARHPEFTQHLLEIVYPGFLAPVPSAAIAELVPDSKEAALKEGLRIPRGSSLRTPLAKGERTASEFRTAHALTLWPLAVAEARYLSGSGSLSSLGLPPAAQAKAAIRLRLQSAPGAPLREMPIDALDLHIKAPADVAARIYEQVHANCLGVAVRAPDGATAERLGPASVVEIGLDDDSALLPAPRAGFAGYRLLQEYFMLPERLLFFGLRGLRSALQRCAGEACELFLLLDRASPALESALDASQFRLHCTPVINLFPKSCDRTQLDGRDTEYHVIPDRNRPMDFEIFRIEKVTGISGAHEEPVEILPFYATGHRAVADEPRAFYTIQRRHRLYSARQQRTGERTSYVGTECFISVVDAGERAIGGGIEQADIQALCTNRDLPLHAAFAHGGTDFLLEGGAPLAAIRCITGPSAPRPSPAFGETAWRLVSHLALNYLSLQGNGAPLLRDFLSLYADGNDSVAAHQIEGIRAVSYEPVVRRLPMPGPISHGRGLLITLALEDAAFEGAGLLPLAAVLDRFFARYVSLNSFTQLRLVSTTRGEIKQWPVRAGTRQIL